MVFKTDPDSLSALIFAVLLHRLMYSIDIFIDRRVLVVVLLLYIVSIYLYSIDMFIDRRVLVVMLLLYIVSIYLSIQFVNSVNLRTF
jgi:hypothetical protein